MLLMLARVLFYPTLVVLSLASYFLFADPGSSQQISILSLKIGIVAIVLIHVSERLLPFRADWNRPRADRWSNFASTNLIFPVLAKTIEIGTGFFVAFFVSDVIRDRVRGLWPSDWHIVGQLMLALVVCEFFYYWIHRLGHRFAKLWAFHSIHHAVPYLYWDNAGRFHPVDLMLNLFCYLAPLSLLAPPPMVLGAFLVLNMVTGLLEHANVNIMGGPLNYIFNTAELHRWHHATDPKISSNNFGKVLAIWDVAFSTWFLPKDKVLGEVGVTTEIIPADFWGQMKHPFRRLKL